MASNKKIRMKQRSGTGYNILWPETTADQVLVNNGSTTVDKKFSNMVVYLTDYSSLAVNIGLADEDWGPAFFAAIASLATTGGKVKVPKGSYQSSEISTIYDNIFIEGDNSGTKIKPVANGQVVIRIPSSNSGLSNIVIDGNGKTGITGIALTPHAAYTGTLVFQNFNHIENIYIYGCQEGIILQCGDKYNSQDSGCWYNNINNIHFSNNIRCLWLKNSTGATGAPANRNHFNRLVFGQNINTGVQIDAGDTNTFVSCAFEGIQLGSSPNTIPTAIVITEKTISGYDNKNNVFMATYFESCTRDIENNAIGTQFYGNDARIVAGTKPLSINFGSDPSGFPIFMPGLVYPEGAGYGSYRNGAYNIEKPISLRNSRIFDNDYEWNRHALTLANTTNTNGFQQIESWFTSIGGMIDYSCRMNFGATVGTDPIGIGLPITPHNDAYTNYASTGRMVFPCTATVGTGIYYTTYALMGNDGKIYVYPPSGQSWHTATSAYNSIQLSIRYMKA